MLTSHDRPRLREDLLAEAIEEQGARFVDLIDPDTGSSFRFYDVEYSLACAMDGERDVPGLVKWAQEELGLAPSPAELQTVISTLGELGYLAGPQAAARITPVGMPAAEPAASELAVDLGRFQAPVVDAAPVAAAPVELGAAGPSVSLEPAPAPVELALGPSGAAADELPTPDPSRVPTRPSVPRASRPKLEPVPEPRLEAVRPEPVRSSEPKVASPVRSSEPKVAPVRSSEPKAAPVRSSEPKVAEPRRASEQALRANALAPVPPAMSDPSLNLSLPIRPDDVKEAVRASREMRSVDVPSDLMEALEAAERPVERRRPSSVPPMPPVAVPSVATTPSATLAAVKPSPAVLDPIAPLPGASVSVSEPLVSPSVPPLVPVVRTERPALLPVPKEPVAAPAVPAPARSNKLFIALLVVAIIAVLAVIAIKLVLGKRADDGGGGVVGSGSAAGSAAPQPEVAPPPPPPPAPVPVTATLTLVKASAVTVKMPAAGVLQSVVASGTDVKEGDAVAVLAGAKPIEQKIAQLRADLDKRYPEDVKRIQANLARAAGNRELTAQYTAELNRRNARIAQRTTELEQANAELAKLSVPAAIAGKVTPMAKAGARLAADAEVASIEPAPYLRAITDLREPVKQGVGDPIDLRAAEGGAPITCTVKVVQDTKVEMHCPLMEGFSDGTELVYQPKK